jgi:hypothetical protein
MTTAHGSRKSHVYYLFKNKFLGGLSLRHLRKLSPKKLHHRSPGKTFPWPPVEEPTLDCRPIQSPPRNFMYIVHIQSTTKAQEMTAALLSAFATRGQAPSQQSFWEFGRRAPTRYRGPCFAFWRRAHRAQMITFSPDVIVSTIRKALIISNLRVCNVAN